MVLIAIAEKLNRSQPAAGKPLERTISGNSALAEGMDA